MNETLSPDAGGSLYCFRHETAIESPEGQISKGEDNITICLLPPYANSEEETAYLQLTFDEATKVIERLAHLVCHSEETVPETDENEIPLFINPIEKTLYE